MVNMQMRPSSGDEAYPYTVVSRLRDEAGFPINDRHTLWESCSSEAMAMAYAERRCAQGLWVDVFKNIAESVSL